MWRSATFRERRCRGLGCRGLCLGRSLASFGSLSKGLSGPHAVRTQSQQFRGVKSPEAPPGLQAQLAGLWPVAAPACQW